MASTSTGQEYLLFNCQTGFDVPTRPALMADNASIPTEFGRSLTQVIAATQGPSHAAPRPLGQAMGKLSWTAIFVLGAALAADQYWNYGYYTDGTMNMLGQIRRSFGW
jgi:hypothetical protein